MNSTKSRLELTDTPMNAIIKMAEGNPGAIRVLMELFHEGAEIDPDSFMGSITGMRSLDSLGIYGHRIWGFYKDVSGEDVTTMMGLMRAHQLGFLRESELIRAIDGERKSEGWAAGYLTQVRERLPRFGRLAA